MFDKLIEIYNAKHKRQISKRTLTQGWVLEGLCSYQYGRKLIDAVNAGKQLRINWKILKYTADYCEITMDELFEQLA